MPGQEPDFPSLSIDNDLSLNDTEVDTKRQHFPISYLMENINHSTSKKFEYN